MTELALAAEGPSARRQRLPSEADVTCLARAIYFEARGLSERSREAVAHVVMNRMAQNGRTACDVVNQRIRGRPQFTFNHGRSPRETAAWTAANTMARRMLTHRPHDFTRGATHFYNHRLVRPSWADKTPSTWRDNAHAFHVVTR